MYLTSWQLVSGHPLVGPVHRPLDLTITQPGVYALSGANGCGKSTLMKTWLGLLPPLAGHFQCLPVGQVGYVPQVHTVNKFFHVPVFDFVQQGLGVRSPSFKKHHQNDVQQALAQWQLDMVAKRSFHDLSLGQKTRALIARALISKPQLLFLDEPLASLDRCCQGFLMDCLKDLSQNQHMCIFIIDHHLEPFWHQLTGLLNFQRTEHDQEISTIDFHAFPASAV